MKKLIYLFLTLFTAITYAQADFPEGVQISGGQPTVTNDPYLTTTGTTGVQGKISPVNVLIPYTPINYSIAGQTIGQQIAAIDAKIGTMGTTSAGLTQRVDFTADNTTVNSVVYFASSLSGKGSTASGSPPALVLPDNTKAFFTKDVISIAQPAPTIGYAGVYSGNLTVSASPTPVATKQRFTVEIYRTDNLGNPISSGVSGAPVGDLAVTVLAILDSGELNLTAGSITNIPVSGRLTQNVTINTGERLRYHVSAAKIGTGGGSVTFGVYYGTSYNSYYDIPVAITTDAVLDKSDVPGAVTDTDALNYLNTNKANNSDVVHKTGSLSETITGFKNFSDKIIFGETTGTPQDIWEMPSNSFLKFNKSNASQFGFDITTFDADNFFWTIEEGTTRQCFMFADGDTVLDSDIFGISSSQDSGVSWLKNLSVTQAGKVYVRDKLGVGTNTPNYNIQSHMPSANSFIQITSANTGSTNLDGVLLGVNADLSVSLINREISPILFSINGAERLRFHSSGGVSINNTTDPGMGNLSVTGNVSATSYSGSATLTGTPTAPTATAGTNTTQIATTAFVQASTRPYKVYTALLSQTGTSAPTATILENNTGATITWSRTSTGVYVGTASSNIFAANKTGFLATPYIGAFTIGLQYGTVNSFTVDTRFASGNTFQDAILNLTMVEVRIYN